MKETIVDMLHAGMENRLTKSVHTTVMLCNAVTSITATYVCVCVSLPCCPSIHPY